MKYTLRILYGIVLCLATLVVAYLYWKQTNTQEGFEDSGNVYVFYHIFCNKNTDTVVLDQAAKLLFSGLYARVKTIYCFLAGDKDDIGRIRDLLLNYGSKFQIGAEGPGDKSYERFTLLKIRNYIQPSDKFLYIHSKGVSPIELTPKASDNKEAIFWWRTYMEYFLMTKINDCISYLNTYDVVGLPYTEYLVGPHFSGNFWWSTGTYFLGLSNQIGEEYTDPETYIMTGHPKFKTLDENRFKNVPLNENINLYKNIIYSKVYLPS
jgi:hypothetical protein